MMTRTWTADDHDDAQSFLASIDDPTQRSFLDLLTSRPGERFDTAAVARSLGLDDHRDVARATYAMGQSLAARGFGRPWTEAQQGYAMATEIADLFTPTPHPER